MAFQLPPVVATIVADSKEFSATLDKDMAKMDEFAGSADAASGRFSKFASKASTAIIGVGVAIAGYGVDKAIKFETALQTLQRQTDVSDDTLKKISKSAIDLSNNTSSTATEIVSAYEAAAKAGYGWAKSQEAVTAAAKLAQISGDDVTTTTQALIAAQNLGITKGMSAAKVADLLTIALKGNENGLSGVVGLLSGKVGSAFGAYHQSAGEAVAVANEFSLAGITQTRQIATFINKLGALHGPLEDTVVTNGKLTTSSAGYVNSLVDVGLNVDKTREAFTGPNGLINGLKYLKTTADGSLPKLQQYLTAIFGTTGVASGMALINNIDKVTQTVKAANSATSGGLNTAFNLSQGDIDNKLKELRNRWENILQGVGMFLLPDVEDLANWTETATKYFEAHPLLGKIASDAAIGLFATAVAYKIGSALSKVIGGVTKVISKVPGVGGTRTSSLDYLKIIADNTTKIAESTGLSAKEGAGTDVEGGVGDAELAGGLGGVATKFGQGVTLFAAGVASFEITSDLLRTAVGKKVGNFLTSGGGYNPIHDLANALSGILGDKLTATTKLGKIGGGERTSLYNQELAAIKAGNTDLANKFYNEIQGLDHHSSGSSKSVRGRVGTKVLVHVHG